MIYKNRILKAKVGQPLYESVNPGDVVGVRYAAHNPCIALLEGEEGFDQARESVERARETVYGGWDQEEVASGSGATSEVGAWLAGWPLWLQWAVASTLGWVIGDIAREVVDLPGGAFLAGAIVGGMQWLVLRAHVRQAGWWVLASAAGAGLTGLVVESLLVDTGLLDRVWLLSWGAGVLLMGATVGAVVGAAQWVVLRRWVRRAGWWVLASSAGVALGDALTEVLVPRSLFLDLAMSGAACEVLRGIVLAWLLQNPKEAESPYGEEPW